MPKTNGLARKRPTHFEQIPVDVVESIAIVDVEPSFDPDLTSPEHSARVAPDHRQLPRARPGPLKRIKCSTNF